MVEKRRTILETRANCDTCVQERTHEAIPEEKPRSQRKGHKGTWIAPLKVLLLLLAFYSLRFSEAHNIGQSLKLSEGVGPIEEALGQGLAPDPVNGLNPPNKGDSPDPSAKPKEYISPFNERKQVVDAQKLASKLGTNPFVNKQPAYNPFQPTNPFHSVKKPDFVDELTSNSSTDSQSTTSSESSSTSSGSSGSSNPFFGANNPFVAQPSSTTDSDSSDSSSSSSSSEPLSPEAVKLLSSGGKKEVEDNANPPKIEVPTEKLLDLDDQPAALEAPKKPEPVVEKPEAAEQKLEPPRPRSYRRYRKAVRKSTPPPSAANDSTDGDDSDSEDEPEVKPSTSQAAKAEETAEKAAATEPVEEKPADLGTLEEPVAGPSENVFRSPLKPTLPEVVPPKEKGRVTLDDDFELFEVEKVDPAKLDPHMTQHVDNSLLKAQRESQLIGTQIPLATSFEYNRNAHVLEPKFESPKVIGGIIQTLTDRESKLRRMEKRRLKIQHDLSVYISKESANVVNMLNNGEVNRLQKVHPLVFMRLQEVLQTQHALDALIKKDGDKVKRYDKSWYLNSTATTKKSFIEEIRKYSKDDDLYGKFKKPKKIKESRESVYNKLELFHNEYICQRVVRENQYAEKVLRSLEQQSGLYLAPFYHNIVPGLGNLWLMKNFEKYYMEAVKSKATTFGKVAPTVVGRFMLMVENGTVLPSTPSSQVAIHSLSIMLSLVMDGVKEPRMFLGRKKFYGFMSLCNASCLERIYEHANKKDYTADRQIEFLKWVLTFYSEDLLLIDTYAQRIVLHNMYAVTREDIFRSSPKNVQLRIQSEFSEARRLPRRSLLQLGDAEAEESLLQLADGSVSDREEQLRRENERLLRQHGEKRRQEYRQMQLDKLLDQQKREVDRQREERESDAFTRAMRERARILRQAEQQAMRARNRQPGEVAERPLFKKEHVPVESSEEEKEKSEVVTDKNVYDTARERLENLGASYRTFLNRFMSGYHAPGKDVDPNGSSQSIVPFHVFVPSNRPSGGYDGQFLDVVQTITELTNLANKDNNAYFHALNTFILLRTVHTAIHSFETAKARQANSSRTVGSLFRWLNSDSSRYVSHLPKKYLPFASLSLQLVMFFQELVENYSSKITKTVKSFFKGIINWDSRVGLNRPRSFSKLNANLETEVIYNSGKYRATLQALKELVDLFKDTFVSKPSIPGPIIQYITVFTALWAQSDAESLNLSEKGAHRAKKMFFLSYLSNEKSLADMGTAMILNSCAGLKMLHLGCVARITAQDRDCNQISVPLTRKKVLHILRAIEATSPDPLDVIRIASDTCRRCISNLSVRTHVGAPVISFAELGSEAELEKMGALGELDDGSTASDGEQSSAGSDSGSESGSSSSSSSSSGSDSSDASDAASAASSGSESSLSGVSLSEGETPAKKKNKIEALFSKNPFKKELSPEEQAMMLPHFTDRLMLHSEITQRVQCYLIQKRLVDALVDALGAAKDEIEAKQIVTGVFADYRTIEVVQSGMASSIHRLICPYMMDAAESLRVPWQTNIIRHALNKVIASTRLNILKKDMFKGLRPKVALLVPTPDSFQTLTDLSGCVFVGTRRYNGVFFSGGFAPFEKVDKPTNIMLKPGEGRLVYDGDNFVPELSALGDVVDLVSINVVHEREFERYVYEVRNGPVTETLNERQFALKYHNFIVRAHVLLTARALLKMGFDMGRVVWCGDKYGWVADFALEDVVSSVDIPVYNGTYWLLTSQLSVKDVVGSFPVKFVNDRVGGSGRSLDLGAVRLGDVDVEITSRGRKVGTIRAHGSGVESEVESSDDESVATDFLTDSVGAGVSATPGALKSVRGASFNPAANSLTLDLDMPDFVFGS